MKANKARRMLWAPALPAPKQFSVLLYDWRHPNPVAQAKLAQERARYIKRISAKLKQKDHGEYRLQAMEEGVVRLSCERVRNMSVRACTAEEAQRWGKRSIPYKVIDAVAATATRIVFEQRSK